MKRNIIDPSRLCKVCWMCPNDLSRCPWATACGFTLNETAGDAIMLVEGNRLHDGERV